MNTLQMIGVRCLIEKFLSNDFSELQELFWQFKAGLIPLLMIEGDIFTKSVPLEHSKIIVSEKKLLPQEVLPLVLTYILGFFPFGIWGERLEMVQIGIKVTDQNEIEPRSVAGTGDRKFHGDNVDCLNHWAEIMLLLIINAGGN